MNDRHMLYMQIQQAWEPPQGRWNMEAEGMTTVGESFEGGFKMGYKAGFHAALNTFSMKLHDLSHDISFFTDEQIEARYQEWFGPKEEEGE